MNVDEKQDKLEEAKKPDEKLNITIRYEDDVGELRLYFGRPVDMVGMKPKAARELADMIRRISYGPQGVQAKTKNRVKRSRRRGR